MNVELQLIIVLMAALIAATYRIVALMDQRDALEEHIQTLTEPPPRSPQFGRTVKLYEGYNEHA